MSIHYGTPGYETDTDTKLQLDARVQIETDCNNLIVYYPDVVDQSYIVGDPHTEYRFNLFSIFPDDCGEINYYYGIYDENLDPVYSYVYNMFNATIRDTAPMLQVGQYYRDNSLLFGLEMTYKVQVFITLTNAQNVEIYQSDPVIIKYYFSDPCQNATL